MTTKAIPRGHDLRAAVRRLIVVNLAHTKALQENTAAQQKVCKALARQYSALARIESLVSGVYADRGATSAGGGPEVIRDQTLELLRDRSDPTVEAIRAIEQRIAFQMREG